MNGNDSILKIMFENKTKVLVVIFVLISLLITFMALPLIVHNEEIKVLMYKVPARQRNVRNSQCVQKTI